MASEDGEVDGTLHSGREAAEDGELCIAGAKWLKTGRKIERCIAGARWPVGDSVMVGTRWAPCGVGFEP
jgi:hypothetical protein